MSRDPDAWTCCGAPEGCERVSCPDVDEGPHNCCGNPDDCDHYLCPWSDEEIEAAIDEVQRDLGWPPNGPGCEGSTSGEGA